MFEFDSPCAYAGIGARRTPRPVLEVMYRLAVRLGERGHTLRSGGAAGADSAFEHGARLAGERVEVFLPWLGYNGRRPPVQLAPPPQQAFDLAAQHHPAWERCSDGVRSMHARNAQIVLGEQLDDPVRFVVCYTPGAQGGGGTGQALRMARHARIPIHDLADTETMQRALGWLERCR